MASTAIGSAPIPALQRGLEVIKIEPITVCSPAQAVEEAAQEPSPATRFLCLLEEELQPESYVLPRDSQGSLVDLLRMITVALRSGDPNASLLSLISQESVIQTPSIDSNDLELDGTGELVYPVPFPSSAVTPGLSA